MTFSIAILWKGNKRLYYSAAVDDGWQQILLVSEVQIEKGKYYTAAFINS